MGAIEVSLVSNSLISGSDPMRTAVGGYWSSQEDSIDPDSTTLQFTLYGIQRDYLSNLRFDTGAEEVVDSTVILPNGQFPMRVAGDQENVKSDIHWKALWLGGAYGDESYPALYSDRAYTYSNIAYSLPYPAYDATIVGSEYASAVVQVDYNYSDYLPLYQSHINAETSERLIPNFYVMVDWSLADFYNEDSGAMEQERYEPENINYMSREGQFQRLNDYFAFDRANISFPTPPWMLSSDQEVRKRNTVLTVDYLTSSYLRVPLSSSTEAWVDKKYKTLLFDSAYIDRIATSDVERYATMLPYSVNLSFPNEEPSTFLESIKSRLFDARFLKVLYESYSGMIDELEPKETNYVTKREFYTTSSDDSSSISSYETAGSETFREIDYIDFLAYCHNNYDSVSDECMIMGPRTIQKLAAQDTTGIYRHINTVPPMRVLDDVVDYLEDPANFSIDAEREFYGNVQMHCETLAYRIEKIGGPPTGDSQTQNTIQNFWFINGALSPEGFQYYDSQVRYDTEYTYKIYAYKLMVGYKYAFDDLRLTRQLGCEDSKGDPGLEFYDPFSDDEETADKLYLADLDYASKVNEFATKAQVFSKYRYLADMMLKYEPSVKIFEVPIYSKTLKVLDNPPNRLMVTPYQLGGNVNKLGFSFIYETFSTVPFPSIISEEDQEYKDAYIHAHDYIDGENLPLESVSWPRYMEIYRLNERPTSVTDFDDNLLIQLDLKMDEQRKYTYTSDYYDDTIRSNHKYYYVFRVLNQQGNISALSEIYEAELVNDGGYKYAVFNILYEHELEQDIYDKTSINFKKLIQIKPNVQQINLITDNLNYGEPATEQIDNLEVGSAEDLIWDKTFKIRLTSKKTGKKIDLNITYKLNSD